MVPSNAVMAGARVVLSFLVLGVRSLHAADGVTVSANHGDSLSAQRVGLQVRKLKLC